jgi:hypothetical protein
MSSSKVRETLTRGGNVLLDALAKVSHGETAVHVATGVPRSGTSLAALPCGTSVMNVERVWAAILAMAVLIAVSNLWTKQSQTRQIHALAQPAPATTSVIDSKAPELPASDEEWAEPRIDLNGNEIDDAVGDYRIDRRGEMYERHAPDTALLRLSAPSL